MSDERAVFTALPNGINPHDRSLARVSIVVSPRLTADGGEQPLGAFEAFRDWPQTLAGTTLNISPPAGAEFRNAVRDPSSPQPDSTLWKALFDADCTVRSRTFTDLSPRRLRSFPAAGVLQYVRALYGDVALNSATEFPSVTSFEDRIGRDVDGISSDPRRQYTRLDNEVFAQARVDVDAPTHIDRGSPPYTDAPEYWTFTEAYRFYDRPDTRYKYRRSPDPSVAVDEQKPPALRPTLDFSSCCTLLGDYPQLLRRLGLVIDVLVPLRDLGPSGTIRVVAAHPAHGWMAEEALRPAMRFTREQESFVAAPRTKGDFDRRMLNLALDRWAVTDLDLDGSAMKYVDFAQTVANLVNEKYKNSDAPTGCSLPALKGGGITVFRIDRAEQVAGSVKLGKAIEKGFKAAGPAQLWLDDVVRGFRVDVGRMAGGKVQAWRSLMRRDGTYVIHRQHGDIDIAVTPDEGFVKSSVVTSVPDGEPDLYLHEAMFGWDGWSLAVSRPGKTIGLDETPTIPAPAIDREFPLDVRLRPVPGSLPALRYGTTYRLRARAVDLAGNSLPLEAVIDDALATKPFTYRRWEPVGPPVLVPRRPFNEGESLQRMVIRSTAGITAAHYATLPRVVGLPDHGTTSGADNLDRSFRPYDERHIAAPKTSQQMAEQHGKFDAAMGQHPQAIYEAAFLAAAREAGSFLDVQVSDPDDPSVVTDISSYVHVVNHDLNAKPRTTLPLPRRGDPLSRGEYVVHDTDQLLLPYLPDVLARGLSFRGVPGAPNGEHTMTFQGDWPQAWPIRLRIEGGTQSPVPDLAHNLLTVFVPPAEVARLRVSCQLLHRDLNDLGVWSLRPPLPPLVNKEHEAAAKAGKHWMLTPWTEIVLVHAVEKPLAKPRFTALHAGRAKGETFASLLDTMSVHAKSTGRIDIEATWQESVDDVARPAPTTSFGHHAHVADFRIEPAEAKPIIARDDKPAGSGKGPEHRLRHEFGDTKHRNVTYTPIATTRFREYFPPAITNDADLITQPGPERTIHVPSSRRPEPPDVHHIVPTFQWIQQVTSGQVIRTRRGSGVRVYLRRPWFSSGDDELLGVLLPNQGQPATGTTLPPASAQVPDPAEAARRYLSRWGVDPAWSGAHIAGPDLRHFQNLTRWQTGLRLAETQAALVSVAGFEPAFDNKRGLWYCDIDTAFSEPASRQPYFPFMRLALARYQYYSVKGVELSKAVLADHIQVAPDRTATVSNDAQQPSRVNVTLEGPSAYNALGRRLTAGGGSVAVHQASREILARVELSPKPSRSGLRWQPTGPPVSLKPATAGTDLWTANVKLVPGTSQFDYRLSLEEHELHETDPSEAELTLPSPSGDVPVRRRLVYADHFPLKLTGTTLAL